MLSYFASDIHLHPSRPETARRFVEFLSGPARRAQALYLLGDLFDAWIGDDDIADPFNAGICAALKACAAHGPKLFFLPGNRDFLLGPAFAAAADMTPMADETVVHIGGTPTLLLHGDTLCIDDREYQDFRRLVRSAEWQRDFLAKPLAERRRIAEDLRGRSETEKRAKPMALMDVNEDAVARTFAAHGVRRMIHGHIHRQGHHVQGDCERWVLPEWEGGTDILNCDDKGCLWLALP